MKVERACYCRCGGSISLRIRGTDATNVADGLVEAFWRSHAGDGCGEATQQQAATARRRAEMTVTR